jgi:hypothetical protein
MVGTARTHARIVQHLFAPLLQGARLDSFYENSKELIFEIQGFRRVQSELVEHNGKIYDLVDGEYIPILLIFTGVSKLDRVDFFTSLES